GFPTANLFPPHEEAIPGDGVYITEAMLGSSPIPAVTYIGPQPPFGRQPRLVEVHLLNTKKRLYGKTIRVAFFEWLRGEKAFGSKPELIAQIQRDVQQTLAYFEAQRQHAPTTSVRKEKK